jgi:bacterioferritin-associated ferredoxin
VYACICAAVDEGEVLAAVDAGTGCGGCHDRIEDLIDLRCGACPLAGQRVA